jgi:MYXO-CTERM domain-containing protein
MTGSGTESSALERSYSGTSGMQAEAYGNQDRDGFNFGWLGLLGLAGLLGLRQARRDHVTTTPQYSGER